MKHPEKKGGKAGARAAVAVVDAPSSGPAPAAPEVRDEQIRRRAYELFLARGGQPGRDFEDWLQAERELKARGK